MFTIGATVLIAAAVPASALAHHHGRHHTRHHARFRRFGDQTTAPTSTSSSDNAGTVQSFTNGVLTIALNGGTTVAGTVTNDTELECTAMQGSDAGSQTIHDDGDPGSGGDNQSSGGGTQGSGGDDQASGGSDQGDDDNSQGDDDQNENQSSSCSTSSLTPGAVVHEATLRIGGSGAAWQKIELVS